MVPKISPAGESARSCFDYDVRPKHGQPRGEWVAGTLQGTPRQMARMAGVYRALRPDCRKPVWRCSLSLPLSDGRPSPQKWAEIAQDFLKEMGVPTDAAWVAMHHGEVDHDHIHITLLRTLPDGTLWIEERSAKRAIRACQKLEAIHQLASHDRTPKPKNTPTRAEIEIFNRQQKKGKPVMSREIIQAAVDQILADYPPPKGIDFVDLQQLLAAKKPPIDLQASMPKGVFRGVSYQFESFKWPGSKIGREWSVGLVERGVRMPTSRTGATQPPEVADPFLSQADQPSAPARDMHAKAPTPLKKTLLRPPSAQHQFAAKPSPAQATTEKWEIDLKQLEASTLNIGPLSAAMLLVSASAVNFSIEVIRRIWEFVRALLAKFGFGMRPVTQQVVGGPSKLIREPYTVEGEIREIGQAEIDAAAGEVARIAEALAQKDGSLLPRNVEGRAELAAALDRDQGLATGVAAASDAAPNPGAPAANLVDAMFTGDDEGAASGTEQEDALASLEAAGNAYLRARKALVQASSKPPQRPDFTVVAQQALNRAAMAERDARQSFDLYRKHHPVKSRIYESDESQKLERATAEVIRLKIELATEKRRTAENQKVHDALPIPKPPTVVVAAAGAALAEFSKVFEKARQIFSAEIAHVIDPTLKAQLELTLKRASSKFANLPLEGRPETLKAGIELVQDVRRDAAADLARRMAARPEEREIAVDDEMVQAQR